MNLKNSFSGFPRLTIRATLKETSTTTPLIGVVVEVAVGLRWKIQVRQTFTGKCATGRIHPPEVETENGIRHVQD
jgi:hypothetical protein